jgi:hypothetical protein
MLDACKSLIESGAYYCSCSVSFLQWEGQNLQPYPQSLPDLPKTQRIREGHVRREASFTPEEIERTLQLHTRLAKNMLVGTVARVAERIGSERPDIAKNVKMLPSDRRVRMRQWLDGLDRIGMYEVAVRSMPEGWVKDLTGFCRGKEWISWQYFRLASVLANEYYYLRQMGGIPGNHRAEHDYQDMEYVLLLSRAEGLLTRDQRVVTPLAQAAFPDKDVFFKLDEVPEEYLCHWS